MKKAKKPHPSEIYDNGIIAEAEYFTAFLRTAPTEKIVIKCATQEKAFAEADKLDIIGRPSGRQALVYAVNSKGQQAVIDRPRRIQPRQ